MDCSCTNSENLCVKTIGFVEVPNYENGDNNTFDSLQFSLRETACKYKIKVSNYI